MEEILNPSSTVNWDVLFEKIFNLATALGSKLVAAIIIFAVGRWIVRKLKKMICTILVKREVEASLATFTRSLTSIVLNFLLVLIVVGTLGVEISSIIALFASIGVGIGMALSGTLQNFAGGIMILLFKPFKVGDYIEAQGQSGTVKEIQIFNTILTTLDNKVIIVPNGGLSTGITKNYSKEDIRRVDWEFGIAYGDSYDKAKAVIERLLDNDKRGTERACPFYRADIPRRKFREYCGPRLGEYRRLLGCVFRHERKGLQDLHRRKYQYPLPADGRASV